MKRGESADPPGVPREALSELKGESREPGLGERLNLGEPAEPRPSASIALLRHGPAHADHGLEVLLARRTEQARFMPGVWVFPGGGVDAADGGDPETAEEPAGGFAGDGGCGDLESDGGRAHRACAVRELAEEVGIELGAPEELVAFARWITPEVVSTRFDAWFFLALAPPHAAPRPDGVEAVDAGWFTPAGALEAAESGELELAFPTVRQLRQLAGFATASEAIEAYRERPVEPILPKPIERPGGEIHLALPGDPEYPEG